MSNPIASLPPRFAAWMWRGLLVAIVVMPLLIAGLFGQLPWQTDAAPPSLTANQTQGSGPAAAAIITIASPTSANLTAMVSESPTQSPVVTVPSPTPTVVASTADVFPPGSVVSATVNLNQRASSSTGSPVLTVLQRGTRMTVTGPPVQSDGHVWYPVSAAIDGWVVGDFLAQG